MHSQGCGLSLDSKMGGGAPMAVDGMVMELLGSGNLSLNTCPMLTKAAIGYSTFWF